MNYFRVKEWDKYQHYKDRSPPWIKLHRETLSSQTWVMLDDDKKALAIACMLLAAATDNKIPLDPAYVQRVAYLKTTPVFDDLLACDFIEIIEEKPLKPARRKQVLADASKPYSEERREETEKRQNGNHTVVPTDVSLVFDHWRTTHNHPSAKLDPKREKVIRLALKSYSPEQLCDSIAGWKNSAFHMGDNPGKTVYDALGLLLRDGDQIDKGISLAGKKGGAYDNSI